MNLMNLFNIDRKISDFQNKYTVFKDTASLMVNMHFRLIEPLTIDELFALMTERWNTGLYGNFRLQKTLFGKTIHLDHFLTKRFEVKTASLPGKKNLWVHIIPADHTPSNEDLERINAMGGYQATMYPVMNYMSALRNEMRNVLGDNVKE